MNANIRNRLNIEIKKAYYVFTRYKSPCTFAILYHEEELHVAKLGEFVRISDHLLKVDDNHYFINFAFTEQNGAFKASQNLILYLDKHFNNRTSCIAVDTFDSTHSSTIVINRLMQILQEIKKDPYSRIEDENILNGLV
ncbi:hypothetical protein GJV85_08935 [Sulfurimonas aquatica]|uniref:Uncharacterized protein n=1 Tax=Sulfurimonas aquatica TaxID=2672570 RepID=A0A975GD55_9BACT|nr:hypothetical protein [Sulfurimonas aquatica]QSZ42232.1 hypothetical protein GJV85_08935 [Sulfurimonas aquatica]